MKEVDECGHHRLCDAGVRALSASSASLPAVLRAVGLGEHLVWGWEGEGALVQGKRGVNDKGSKGLGDKGRQ